MLIAHISEPVNGLAGSGGAQASQHRPGQDAEPNLHLCAMNFCQEGSSCELRLAGMHARIPLGLKLNPVPAPGRP